MRTVLVTGGTGFIGSHTCINLLEKGYKIIIIDSLINSSIKSLEHITKILKRNNSKFQADFKFYKGNLINKEFIHKVFFEAKKKGSKIDAVVHFAGLKSVQESIDKPLLYWRENVIGTLNLLEVMSDFLCNKIVFSSSATIYKASHSNLINEGSDIEAINPYGNTKIANEKLLNDVYQSNKQKWSIINLRYFNPIGAHPSGLIGEYPNGMPSNIFPLIMKSASDKGFTLKVFGNDWPTKDGTCIRDYIHVMDLADGHIKALEFLDQNYPSIFNVNLGTGKGTSVLELIKTFEIINNVKINFNFDERRAGDLCEVVADNKLANKLFRWKPSRTINEMCRDGWLWNLKNPNGFE